jgi:RNA polymerase sigma factor (sigma-70 family)
MNRSDSNCLILEYMKFAFYVARKKAIKSLSMQHLDDLVSAAYLGLVESARRLEILGLDGKVKTFIYKSILGKVVDEFLFLNWGKRYQKNYIVKAEIRMKLIYESDEKSVFPILRCSKDVVSDVITEIDFCSQILFTPQEKQILLMLADGDSEREVAVVLGMAQSNVHRIVKKMRGIWDDYSKSKNIIPAKSRHGRWPNANTIQGEIRRVE